MSKRKNDLRIRARIWVTVDEVDIEQEKLERDIKSDKEAACEAARAHPRVAGLDSLATATGSKLQLRSAKPLHKGNWQVMFTIGMEDARESSARPGDIL